MAFSSDGNIRDCQANQNEMAAGSPSLLDPRRERVTSRLRMLSSICVSLRAPMMGITGTGR